MVFGAAITLYNPTDYQIKRAISMLKSFDYVFLFDNTDGVSIEKCFSSYKNIIYLTEKENKGLPYAFNTIFPIALEHGVDFICTLDQDSTFKEEDISSIKDKISSIKSIDKLGIVAPFVNYGSDVHEYKEPLEKKKYVITSGSFINLKLVSENDIKYDESYFIDKFEIDFCQQLFVKGFEVFMFHSSVLHQELGHKGKNGKHANHSPLRHYYLFRNRFYFNKKWFKPFKCFILNLLQTLKHFLRIAFLEDEKKAKFEAYLEAKRDFKKCKFGKKR